MGVGQVKDIDEDSHKGLESKSVHYTRLHHFRILIFMIRGSTAFT